MTASPALDPLAIRRAEDAFVDALFASAPDLGAPTIAARCARAYIDLNREALELDPGMFADELPEFARARTARFAAGLGAIAREVSEGPEIYDCKLMFADARVRIKWGDRPSQSVHERLLACTAAAQGR